MTTFVLVPGGWQGAWVYGPVVRRLRRRGHRVWAVTHAGVDRRRRTNAAGINLDTHIADVIALLDRESLSDVVLCGHSYGGFVVSGVADAVPDRISRLVYVDAYVPQDGESCWSMTSDWFRDWIIEGVGEDGYFVAPHPRWDPRSTRHPLASFVQRIRLTGAWREVQLHDFVYLTGWRNSPITASYERVRDDPAWTTHVLPAGHALMLEDPDALVDILLPTPGVG